MSNKIKASIFVFAFLVACQSKQNYAAAENALDAGREFIDACLKGDFNKADFYLLHDAVNQEYLLKEKKSYGEKSNEQKKQFNEASIIINEEAIINDSTHIINYKNSFDKTAHAVKVISRNNHWQVDLKYTFNGNL
jgi:hypothetical protein